MNAAVKSKFKLITSENCMSATFIFVNLAFLLADFEKFESLCCSYCSK